MRLISPDTIYAKNSKYRIKKVIFSDVKSQLFHIIFEHTPEPLYYGPYASTNKSPLFPL